MMTRLFSVILPLMLVLAPPAKADLRAVLVGVSDYLVLDADLKGPGADVSLMAQVLAARGVTDQTRLTSDGPLPPTKSAIMTALADVAARSVKGDTVVFYFSGHGGQAPDQNGDEGGGNDEIFLPADAAGWKGAIGAVENAILDDELQDWAQPLLARGVRLVAILDACHSDTGFRAVGGRGVARGLGAEALGIPADAVSVPGEAGAALQGEFVFLYSSQSDQRSFEYELGSTGEWHGAFTLKLAEVLRTAKDASWRQILAATANGMIQGPVPQQPDGEGPMLDQSLFGTAAPMRFPLHDGVVQAGLLQGLSVAAELALFETASGGEALAVLPVATADADTARLKGDPPASAAWAEPLPMPPPPLRLGKPVRVDDGDGFDYGVWLHALGPGQTGGDLVPILTKGQVALAGADGVLDPLGQGSTPRIQTAPGESPDQAVTRVLEQAAHALRLRQLFAAVAGRSLTGRPPLDLTWQRKSAIVQGDTCGDPGPAAPVDPAKGVQGCDQIWLSFRNSSGRDLDVSILYFNADFTVNPVWPRQGLSNRLAAGEAARAGVQINATSPPGLDEIMVLAVPVQEGAARVDLTGLASLTQMRGETGPAGWFAAQLSGADQVRGFSTRPAALAMIRQPVRLLPH